ncbi:Pkr1-domain-containing protein [Dendrothele bispora CBS 962.96]|uniref:Pkr1-domain-containing protein n=1 Tax=Dendrothele bispora (strain CBS 962.96) TaxID=1314807 RepID=A0A4V4HHM0_DENBC|nr:Pkr1-domain-containing protein [Dendrothele bispora CBS 962.96]
MADQPIKSESDAMSFFSNILTPGSSLHPTFLLILDACFAALLIILLGLLFATRSIHFVALTAIELALWASVKWFVYELKNTTSPTPAAEITESKDQKVKTS